eukprot:TRINITY_DN10808_c0_g1_i4.p1 TRINITY_DN10808_c0_g1~~TRINITY_DN10808_c0_g1_i4.p1  ORF type:complete len:279 (-),score=40.59 TRINITY_DN10808_c0_g1_i4:275-1111(-)
MNAPAEQIQTDFRLPVSGEDFRICGVARHAERADSAFALWKCGQWMDSEDARRWFQDPPLSDVGEIEALETAKVVRGFAERLNSSIDVVISSPYMRCVQTAAVICAKLGPSTELVLDSSAGEIFSQSVFGDDEPENHRRPLQSLIDECKSRGVLNICPTLFGIEPPWPETLREGKHRFAESFLKHMHRSRRNSQNILIVTHADCVAAASKLFPQAARVTAVEPGGVSRISWFDIMPGAPSRPSDVFQPVGCAITFSTGMCNHLLHSLHCLHHDAWASQ